MDIKKLLLLGVSSLSVASVSAVALIGLGTTSSIDNNVLATSVSKTKTLNKNSVCDGPAIDGSPFGMSFAAGNDDFGKAHTAIGMDVVNVAEINEDELSYTIGNGTSFIEAIYTCNSSYPEPVQIALLAFGFNGITSFTVNYSVSDPNPEENFSMPYKLYSSTYETIKSGTLTSSVEVTYDGGNGTAFYLILEFNAKTSMTITVSSIIVSWSC